MFTISVGSDKHSKERYSFFLILILKMHFRITYSVKKPPIPEIRRKKIIFISTTFVSLHVFQTLGTDYRRFDMVLARQLIRSFTMNVSFIYSNRCGM
jgi:hypothetical protein